MLTRLYYLHLQNANYSLDHSISMALKRSFGIWRQPAIIYIMSIADALSIRDSTLTSFGAPRLCWAAVWFLEALQLIVGVGRQVFLETAAVDRYVDDTVPSCTLRYRDSTVGSFGRRVWHVWQAASKEERAT